MQNNSATASPHSSQPEAPLRRELRRRLLSLPYRAFLQVAVHLLKEQGYTAARPTGRDQWKGRNTSGGWDAEADFQAGALGTLRCIAQVKQFDTLVVAQRHVDELRGTCLRAGAHQAVLITLSTFSPPARKAAQANTSVAPVRLIDGDELLDMLVDTKLCLRRSQRGAWTLDEGYFARLKETSAKETSAKETSAKETSAKETSAKGTAVSQPGTAVSQTSTAGSSAPKDSVLPQFVSITVRLNPPKGFTQAGKWQWAADMGASSDRGSNPDLSGEPQ